MAGTWTGYCVQILAIYLLGRCLKPGILISDILMRLRPHFGWGWRNLFWTIKLKLRVRVCVFACGCVFVWLCFCVVVCLCCCVFVFVFLRGCVVVFFCWCLCVCVSLCFRMFVFLCLCFCAFVFLCDCVFVVMVTDGWRLTPDHSKLMFNTLRTSDYQPVRQQDDIKYRTHSCSLTLTTAGWLLKVAAQDGWLLFELLRMIGPLFGAKGCWCKACLA